MQRVLLHTATAAAPFYVPGLVAALEDAGWNVAVLECASFPKPVIAAAGLKCASSKEKCDVHLYAPWDKTPVAEKGALVAAVDGVFPGSLRPTCRFSLGRQGAVSIASYEQILEALEARRTVQDFAGKTMLVTLGPTIEDFDPARYISNRSTGRMGVALARMAARRGAKVLAIHGPLSVSMPEVDNIECIPVRSAKNMGDAVLANISRADCAILCAAVADFSPCDYSEDKIKKGSRETLTLRMKRNIDILATVGSLPKRPFLVGFAAESTDVLKNANEKMRRKNCDMLCANDITAAGCGFASETNRLHVFLKDGGSREIPLASKNEVASQVLDLIREKMS